MNTDQLQAFVAVVEQGSFRAAANYINKTQPTISAAVSTLEERYDIKLLNRESYRPVLTEEGKVFYREAKALLGRVSELDSIGHELAKGAPPVVSISLSALFASPPALDRVQRFCVMYPHVQLNISTEHLSGVLEQLQLEKADLAIGPHYGLDERYEYVEIAKIAMVTVAAPGYLSLDNHRFASHKELRGKPHILIKDTGSVAPFEHMNLIAGGQRWYVDDYQLKKSLLIAGMGWSRIPLYMIEQELEEGKLERIVIENFAHTGDIPMFLIRLRYQPLSELAKAFWQEMLPGPAE